ncbi:hypothetical protein [Marinobacter salicampi]|uniref:hypothetical protein n=1 Tax=Marinobacter salicampi TaxID=435907 RepID=UPI00140AA74F|nr:hypothetical protein [Marinobacter salicampi]
MNAFARLVQPCCQIAGSTPKDLFGLYGAGLPKNRVDALFPAPEQALMTLNRLGYEITREHIDHWTLRLLAGPLEIHLYSPAELAAFCQSRAEAYAGARQSPSTLDNTKEKT